MAREADGPGSKASRSATVARRAQQIYAGKVDPKAKTKSRLTRTSNPEVLRKRIAKIKDNTARTAAKAAAKEAKAAAKPAKAAKAATPATPATSNRPKRALAVRVGRADRADSKLTAQLKQAKASGNLKKENEIIRRRQRIDRFNKTYIFADLKASRKALTPASPTAPKRTRSARPAGTVAKPRGMKPGVLAAGKGAQSQKKRKVDYAGAVRLLSRQKAAINRLKNPQQTFNGNAAYARQVDARTAKSTPMANAQREIRALYNEYRRDQSSAKSQYASQEVRTRAVSRLPTLRKQIRKAAQAARAFKPEYSAETRRRFQAARARRRP
jgi:hypothetical protein